MGGAAAVDVGGKLAIKATVLPGLDPLEYALKWTTDDVTKAKFETTYTEGLENKVSGLAAVASCVVTCEVVDLYYEGGVRKYKSLATPITNTLTIAVEAV